MTDRDRIVLRQVLFEFIRVGRVVKVVAIDPKSGTEVSMVGDPHASPATLKQLAKRKLEYVLTKRLRPDS